MGDETGSPGDRSTSGAAFLAGGDAARVNTYLDEQTELVRLQIADLRREDAIKHQSLRVRHAIDLIKLGLEAVAAFVVFAIAIAIAVVVWAAANANGLVVEAFSVPPDLASRGLTGEVIAAKVLDRLAALQTQTVSNRAASSYAHNWGDDIKVQIPQTGVSFGEANRFLREWLGHETHITGEIYRVEGGTLAISARTDGRVSPTFIGPDRDLAKLVDQAAQAVYRETQPYRYAVYLRDKGREDEARAIYHKLMSSPSSIERAWAHVGLSQLEANSGNFDVANELSARALAIKPDLQLPYENLAASQNLLSHEEQALSAIRKALALAERGRDPTLSEDFYTVNRIQDRSTQGLLVGDYLAVLQHDREMLAKPDRVTWESAYQNDLEACGSLHDPGCLERAWKAIPPAKDPLDALSRRASFAVATLRLGRWKEGLALTNAVASELRSFGELGTRLVRIAGNPLMAIGHAELGDFETANRLAADTPLDCVRCLRARARVAALQKKWAVADKWYAQAIVAAPSVPFGYSERGEALLRSGDPDGAIAQFRDAVKRGPGFADPRVFWAEALMAQNRSDLALEKFEQAARLAPNWGRLHLKWGKALIYAGRIDEGRRRLSIAANLWLLPDERAELTRFASRH